MGLIKSYVWSENKNALIRINTLFRSLSNSRNEKNSLIFQISRDS
jgi:hypothetical protein